MGQADPRTSAHPTLLWVSVGLVFTVVAVWVVLGKSALILNDAGVRKESILGQQEIAWSQIVETRYRVVPVNVYAHFGLIGALLPCRASQAVRSSRWN